LGSSASAHQHDRSMSALSPKADIPRRKVKVRFGPIAEVREVDTLIL
jgi:hypothetical protein